MSRPQRPRYQDLDLSIEISDDEVVGKIPLIPFLPFGTHVVYEITFTFGQSEADSKTVSARRRFREFSQVHKYWRGLLGDRADLLPPLPKRKFLSVGRWEQPKISDDGAVFDAMLKKAIKFSKIRGHISLWDFVEVETEDRPGNLSWQQPPGGLFNAAHFSPSRMAEIEFEPRDLWDDEEEGEGRSDESIGEDDLDDGDLQKMGAWGLRQSCAGVEDDEIMSDDTEDEEQEGVNPEDVEGEEEGEP